MCQLDVSLYSQLSVTWDYSSSDAEWGKTQSRNLAQKLQVTLKGGQHNCRIWVGRKSVAVRALGLTKGAAIRALIDRLRGIQKCDTDLIICAGAS